MEARDRRWQQTQFGPHAVAAEPGDAKKFVVQPEQSKSAEVEKIESARPAASAATRIDRRRSTTKFPISSRVVSGVMLISDSVAILGSGAILYYLLINYEGDVQEYVSAIGFTWIMTLLLFHFTGLYRFEQVIKPIMYVDKLFVAFATAFLFLFAAAFSLKLSATFSRIWVAAFAAACCFSALLLRLLAAQVVSRLADRQIFTRNVVVAGSGEQSARLLAHIREFKPNFVSVLGVFLDDSAKSAKFFHGYPVLGKLGDLDSFARRTLIDDVIVALPWRSEGQILSVVEKLRELPVNVYLGADLIGFRLNFREPPSHFGTAPILEVIGRPLSGWSVLLKTMEDYLLAGLAALILSPLLVLIAVAVKLDSPGPVFFRQKRFGFNNQVFEIYKFRTMRHAPLAEERTVQATRNDARVTAVGRFLRRTSLDELPQLLNVLNGTMSLVGPRPHAIDHNEEYSRQIRGYFARHRVKPGITGWAQVKGLRGQTDVPEKMAARVKCDIYYAEHWSLLFDLQILAWTAIVVLTSRNAY